MFQFLLYAANLGFQLRSYLNLTKWLIRLIGWIVFDCCCRLGGTTHSNGCAHTSPSQSHAHRWLGKGCHWAILFVLNWLEIDPKLTGVLLAQDGSCLKLMLRDQATLPLACEAISIPEQKRVSRGHWPSCCILLLSKIQTGSLRWACLPISHRARMYPLLKDQSLSDPLKCALLKVGQCFREPCTDVSHPWNCSMGPNGDFIQVESQVQSQWSSLGCGHWTVWCSKAWGHDGCSRRYGCDRFLR